MNVDLLPQVFKSVIHLEVMDSPINCYFWTHTTSHTNKENTEALIAELKTSKLIHLIDQSDTIWFEKIIWDIDPKDIQSLCDKYIAGSELNEMESRLVSIFSDHAEDLIFLLEQCRQRKKGLVLEKPVLDEYGSLNSLFPLVIQYLERGFHKAYSGINEYIYKFDSINSKREERMAMDITRTPGSVLAVMGAGHRGIIDLFQKNGHPATSYYPCDDYPQIAEHELHDAYRTGSLSPGLFAHFCAEKIWFIYCNAKGICQDIPTRRKVTELAKYLNQDHVEGFWRYYTNLQILGGAPFETILESYCHQHDLPDPESSLQSPAQI